MAFVIRQRLRPHQHNDVDSCARQRGCEEASDRARADDHVAHLPLDD
jgi:hypothetical protein